MTEASRAHQPPSASGEASHVHAHVSPSHVHMPSPSHEEGAWCSMGAEPCGAFLSVRQFDEKVREFYYTDGRGIPNLYCWDCRAYVALPHPHPANYRAADTFTCPRHGPVHASHRCRDFDGHPDEPLSFEDGVRIAMRAINAHEPPPERVVGQMVEWRSAENLYLRIRAELERAYAKHGSEPWSRHEFYGVLKEEVDELWDAIKADAPEERIWAELEQVAAMCFRYYETGNRSRK